MSEKKIRVFSVLNEELKSKIKTIASVVSTTFDSIDVTHCVLTFDNDIMVYAALCDENTIGVCIEKKVKE